MRNLLARWQRRLAVGAGTSPENLDAIVASPRFYPVEMSLKADPPAISFVEVGPDIYRRSSFLDHRMIRNPNQTQILCGARELIDRFATVPLGEIRYIFHVAFCCSTLLARYLELLPGTFVLKEPFTPTELAELNRAPSNFAGGLALNDITRLCVHLTARRFNPRDAVIAKLADQCNRVAPALMQSSGASKAVFVGLELRPFLLAGLKTDERRAWIRRRAELAAIDVAPSPLAEMNPRKLNDGEACAYLWLTNGVLLQKLLAAAGPARVLVIDGESIAGRPAEIVREVAAWFGLLAGDAQLHAAIGDGAAGQYSKDPSQTFTREDRRQELAATYSRLGNEVEQAMSWAERLARHLGLNPMDGRMLLQQPAQSN